MDQLYEVLEGKYDGLQNIPDGSHWLCAKISDDDDEDYRRFNEESNLSASEKKRRIKDGESRTELTYWNSLVLGYDRKTAGQWGEEFRNKLDTTLKHCADCVLNWHMKRRLHLQKFAE